MLMGLLADTSLLRREREFRLLYAGQTVSGFGSAITYVVLPLQMYQLTRSPLMVGLLGLAEFFPMLLLAFVGGAMADRFDRRRLVVVVELAMAACCGALVFNAMRAQPSIWVLWVVAGLLAGLGALHRPAMEAMTQQVVPLDEMETVGALQSIRYNIAHIAGPALAGWIAARQGAAAAFGLDALTYAISVILLLRMKRLARVHSGEESITWHSLLEGWRYARRRQDLMGTYLIDMNAMFFGMPNALFPAFAEQWGPGSLGLLYAAPAAGALVASATSGWTKRVARHGVAIAWAAVVWGAAIAAFGWSGSLWVGLACLALAGAADNISGIFRLTMWNQTIPPGIRGRTAAVEMVSYLSGPYLGNAEAGLAARLLGLQASVVAGGLLCMAGCGLIAWRLPGFRAYRSARGGAPQA